MNLNMDNCWGIISGIVNLCMDSCESDGGSIAHPAAQFCTVWLWGRNHALHGRLQKHRRAIHARRCDGACLLGTWSDQSASAASRVSISPQGKLALR